MITLKEKGGLNVGYSDHSLGIAVPIARLLLAQCNRKAFHVSRKMEGPDHKAVLNPENCKR